MENYMDDSEYIDEMISNLDLDNIPSYNSLNINDIFNLKYVDGKYREKNWGYYTYKDIPVPRVSEIIEVCQDQSSLIDWASKINKNMYDNIRNKSTIVGTETHNLVEDYLNNNGNLSYIVPDGYPDSYYKAISTAFNNFKAWEKQLNSLGYFIEDVLYTEKRLTCPYFGGTLDLLVRINGANYILDLKTSKRISANYLIQVCAYLWIIINGYDEDLKNLYINGIGIIRIDKQSVNTFEDLFLNLHIDWQRNIINQYFDCFNAMLNNFYHIINCNRLFASYKARYSSAIDCLDYNNSNK